MLVLDYRLHVWRVQERANALERELYNVPALEIRALIADILADHDAIVQACPLHNMTQRYREIMEDVAASLADMDRAAAASIEWNQYFIRR